MARLQVSIEIPGSTSNLGSGFDTLGLALKLYNRVRLTRAVRPGVEITIAQPGARIPVLTRMLTEAAAEFFKRANRRPFGIRVALSGDIPAGRGLGTSATARLGVIAGLNELSGAGLDRRGLLEIVTALEGHPDNASPAIYGGFTVSGYVGAIVRCLRFPVSSAPKFVTLFPRFEIDTHEARKLVPQSFSKTDTVHSLNRAALITAAFASGEFEALRGVFDDRVHQPHRERLIPRLFRVIRVGERAGALGGFLSGSGSAIICVTLKNAEQVGRAMQSGMPDSDVRILTADNRGFRVVAGP